MTTPPAKRTFFSRQIESRRIEDVWIVHSSLTTQLDTEIAACAYDAFSKWAARRGLAGRVLSGQRIDEPVRHLDLALETEAPASEAGVPQPGSTSAGPELH
jgi:hypothetical protein